jgi:hypothetical protein
MRLRLENRFAIFPTLDVFLGTGPRRFCPEMLLKMMFFRQKTKKSATVTVSRP